MNRHLLPLPVLGAALLGFTGTLAWAQSSPTPTLSAASMPVQSAQTITITGRQERLQVGGWGDTALSRLPVQGLGIDSQTWADAAGNGLSALTRFDASLSDAYNAEGYWSTFTVRGYVTDPRSNFRRDGLPINAETALALQALQRIEVLKGVSGIQAGTSSPAGLINLAVKRPVAGLRQGSVQWLQSGGWSISADLSDRVGPQGQWGWRLNAQASRLDPPAQFAQGSQHLLAWSADWRSAGGALLEVEAQWSHQRQPSVPGLSLLGDRVPNARTLDPRLNLNHQPWTQPVVLDDLTGSVRWQQPLWGSWQLRLHALSQRLHSDDRTAFPFGDFDSDYSCQWCDRFASDGSFSLWEFISNHERRHQQVLDLSLRGSAAWAGQRHQLTMGVMGTRFRARFEDQVFDLAGTSRIDAPTAVPRSALTADASVNRDEDTLEWYARDAISLRPSWQALVGVRHTAMQRRAQRTSAGLEGWGASEEEVQRLLAPTQAHQKATVGWLALTHTLPSGALAYASWGQGLESEFVPNRTRYRNRGQVLSALTSRQWELGFKHATAHSEFGLAAFDIWRPVAADEGSCVEPGSCVRVLDGGARHQGLEGQWRSQWGAWSWLAGAQWLRAERENSATPAVNGSRPVNVPGRSLRLGTVYRLGPASGLAGLEIHASVVAESDRLVLPYDAHTRIGGWARVDLGAKYLQRWNQGQLIWRAHLENAADRRAWKEAPYAFGHAYLFPLAPRTWRLSAQWDW